MVLVKWWHGVSFLFPADVIWFSALKCYSLMRCEHVCIMLLVFSPFRLIIHSFLKSTVGLFYVAFSQCL